MNLRILFALTAFALNQINAQAQTKKFTISGFVTEKNSKESLNGVTVGIDSPRVVNTTNNYGFYSISLPAGKYILFAAFVGLTREEKAIELTADINIDFELESSKTLNEVVVKGQKRVKESEQAQAGKIDIPVQQVKELPAFLGEKDVLKVIQLLPGVQKGSEGQSGIYVRGGGPDQNLIILDDAPVYNVSHLFGFFSLFNGDALKSISLTKGGFPARYGGRLSSVLEMQMKEGNKKKFVAEGGIGLISSRLVLEGPIIKDKMSFLVSARRSYLDLLMTPITKAASQGAFSTGYYFYDLNTKLNYDYNKKNKLYLSGYFGKDKFFANTYNNKKKNGEFGLLWGNATGTFRWNHIINSKLFNNTSVIFSRYQFKTYQSILDNAARFEISLYSGIRDWGLKSDYDYFTDGDHQFRFGWAATLHRFTPSAVAMKDPTNNIKDSVSAVKIDNVELGFYGEDIWKVNKNLKLHYGLRISNYITKSKNYLFPEPRISAAYKLKNNQAIKASYAVMNQYIHLLSNTGISLPIDLWIPTTSKVAPQRSHQVAIGYARDIEKPELTFTAEAYYKYMTNIIAYKEGASFFDISGTGNSSESYDWENKITQGKGWSYGTEFFLQKKYGKFTGWVGYTLSWTQHQFDLLNNGEKYYARYDRRHDASVVGVYKLNKEWTFSAVWVYGTGNAVTLPLAGIPLNTLPAFGQSQWGNNGYTTGQFYGKKNANRMEAYHRMDISVQHHVKTKWGERSWEFSIYNLYSRYNPFFYFIQYNDVLKKNELRKISLFPIIPTITYSFKIK